jgi:hypothetical protein
MASSDQAPCPDMKRQSQKSETNLIVPDTFNFYYCVTYTIMLSDGMFPYVTLARIM